MKGLWRTSLALLLLTACIDDAPVGESRLAVIGGEVSADGLYPTTGALVTAGQVTCTGTLIAPTVVVTAGHCVDEIFLGGYMPGFTLDHDGNDPSAYVVASTETFKHPDFNLFDYPEPGVQIWDDIGVLVLEEPIELASYALLPSTAEADRALLPDVPVEIVGYGLTDQEEMAWGIKTHGEATLVEVGSHELFLGKPGEQQNCNGDSGGPGFLDVDGQPRLVGVVSRSPDSDETCDHGGIHTRVDPYVSWIISVAPQLCEHYDCGGADGVPRPPADEEDESEPDTAGGKDGGGCNAGGRASGGLTGLWAVLVIACVIRRRTP